MIYDITTGIITATQDELKEILRQQLKVGAPPKDQRVVWTPEQDSILRQQYGKIRSNEVCVILGRSLGSVQQRAVKLGLVKKRKKKR